MVNDVNNELLAETTAKLALANHILYDQGVVDGFGHVSVRHPLTPDLFLLSRNRAPALVEPSDILVLDLDGHVIGGDEASYLERFIHAEIYRAQPEVSSVVHSHSPTVVSFAVSPGTSLCPVCHMSGFLHPSPPVYEIRDHAGPDNDMLIRNAHLGRTLAAELGDNAVILMRGHGATVVGQTLEQAVFRAVYTEVNARIQSAALSLGGAAPLTAEEAHNSDRVNTAQLARAWDFWALRARLNPVVRRTQQEEWAGPD